MEVLQLLLDTESYDPERLLLFSVFNRPDVPLPLPFGLPRSVGCAV